MDKKQQKETKEEEKFLISQFLELPEITLTDRDKFSYNFSYKKESPKTVEEWKRLLKI